MKNLVFLVLTISLNFSGCNFGEYADKENNVYITNKSNYIGGVTRYEFIEYNLKNRTLYKVFPNKEKWNMTSFDFNNTHYTANQIIGENNSSSGTYSILDDGILELVESSNKTIWIKATNEDDEKIHLLWTTNKSDLNETIPTKDTYFFKNKSDADTFIK